jgi:predicted lipoprotein
MQRYLVTLAFLIVAAGVFWRYPLFHIVRLDELQAARQQATFDAAAFAKTFWDKTLVPSLGKAQDATELFSKLDNAPKEVRGQFGRKVGVGRTTLFFVRGRGTVTHIDKKGVGISLTGDNTSPDIVLHTGLLFGNVARDATGLLDASNYANSQQFNDISTELNRIIETRVIPVLKEGAATGKTLHFVGCAEVSDTASEFRPLKVIPLEVRFE